APRCVRAAPFSAGFAPQSVSCASSDRARAAGGAEAKTTTPSSFRDWVHGGLVIEQALPTQGGLMTRVACSMFAVVVALSCSSSVFAQDSKSAPLARQLAAALDAGKLDSIAAADPSAPDAFVAALSFPGLQI